jgi:hypothetical protein
MQTISFTSQITGKYAALRRENSLKTKSDASQASLLVA